jgi:phospholipid/cholesterol/gamma-HCH transport system ATP-binding protein
MPSPPVEIRVESLGKSFDGNCALDGINLEVNRGESVAVVGGSGSGKTTLLRSIIGLIQPDKGRVLVADHESEGSPLQDLATLDAKGMERLQRHWAVVFQGNALMLLCRCTRSKIWTNPPFAARWMKSLVKWL